MAVKTFWCFSINKNSIFGNEKANMSNLENRRKKKRESLQENDHSTKDKMKGFWWNFKSAIGVSCEDNIEVNYSGATSFFILFI